MTVVNSGFYDAISTILSQCHKNEEGTITIDTATDISGYGRVNDQLIQCIAQRCIHNTVDDIKEVKKFLIENKVELLYVRDIIFNVNLQVKQNKNYELIASLEDKKLIGYLILAVLAVVACASLIGIPIGLIFASILAEDAMKYYNNTQQYNELKDAQSKIDETYLTGEEIAQLDKYRKKQSDELQRRGAEIDSASDEFDDTSAEQLVDLYSSRTAMLKST